MTLIKSVTILDKLIEKTKNHSIRWQKYSESDINLKPLPASPLDNCMSGPLPDTYSLNHENSYICSFNDGIFALLLYNSWFANYLDLRVQTEKSTCSKTFASTLQEDDVNESAKLKRLYNLVVSLYTSIDIDDFIEDFLKNE